MALGQIFCGGQHNFIRRHPGVLQTLPVSHYQIGIGNGESIENFRIHP